MELMEEEEEVDREEEVEQKREMRDGTLVSSNYKHNKHVCGTVEMQEEGEELGRQD